MAFDAVNDPTSILGKGLPGLPGANKATVGPSVAPIQKPNSLAPPPPPRGPNDGQSPATATAPLDGALGGFERQQATGSFNQASNAQAAAAAGDELKEDFLCIYMYAS